MTDTSASNHVLLTLGDVRQWEDSVRVLDAEIDERVAKRALVMRRIEAARLLFPDAVVVPPESPTAASAAPQVSIVTKAPRKARGPSVLVPWEEAILAFVGRFDRGCTYAQLREHLLNSELGTQLHNGTKSYERSMHNLAGRGAIERGYGRVFTPAAYVAFEREAKESGITPSTQPFSRSPMGEAILKIIHAQPGLRNKQVIAELRNDSEFDAALTPNEGTAHNIIARLARRQNIVKRDDGGAYPGPNFPYDILGLPAQRDRALNGNAASALTAGEVAPSPIENGGRERHSRQLDLH